MLLATGGGLAIWHISTRPMRLLTLFLLFSVLIEILAIALAAMNIRNLFILHIYTMPTYSVLALIFSYWQRDKLRQYLRLSIPIYIVFYLLLFSFGYENLNRPASFGILVMSLLLTFISLYTLFSVLRDSTLSPYHDERFWISLGTLFAFSSNAVIYSAIRSEITIDIWIIHNILCTTGYLCYFGGYQWTRTHTI